MPEDSTSPDLVELTRRYVEALNRRDSDALMSFYAPDAVWDAADTGVGTFTGLAAIRGLLEGWFDAFEELVFEREDVLDLGNGVVLVLVNQKGRPRGGSGYVRRREAMVGLLEDGVVTRLTTYLDIDEARASAERLAQERG
jgi:ketosteroid isomerase-like protein